MNILKLISFTFVVFLSLPSPSSATVYNVLGGTFTINGITLDVASSGGTLNINEGSNAYQGFGEILDPFMFSGSDVNVQTAASVGGVSGGNAPAGNVVDGGFVDMSSFFANWNGNDIYQGNSLASVSLISGGYQIAWQAAATGPYPANTYWTIGIAVVPLPAASWLMLSGVAGLAGVAHRRKKQI